MLVHDKRAKHQQRTMAEPVAGDTKSPGDFLKSIKGKAVVVKLNSGVDYRGAQPGVRWRQGSAALADPAHADHSPAAAIWRCVQASWHALTAT